MFRILTSPEPARGLRATAGFQPIAPTSTQGEAPFRRASPVEILLIEDSPADVRLTQEALAEGKVLNRLHVARDGVEALAFLHRAGVHHDAPTPDIILLDLNMPRLNGWEVLEDIKQDPALRSIPVIVLTTSEADKDVLAAYDLHANWYITKPVDVEQFFHVIQHIDSCWLTIVKLPPRGDVEDAGPQG